MTSLSAKSTHGTKILTKTLQSQIIKETFAKNRTTKALFHQKIIADYRTDRMTDRNISIDYVGILLNFN